MDLRWYGRYATGIARRSPRGSRMAPTYPSWTAISTKAAR